MTLELLNISVGTLTAGLSLTASPGQIVCLEGGAASGKTTLLRAILGFVPTSAGLITYDGELLTPLSAPYLRRYVAYVPQHLSVPDGCTDIPTSYLPLLQRAVAQHRPLLIADEPAEPLTADEAALADQLLQEAARGGAAVVAVNARSYTSKILIENKSIAP
ncbi:MAG: ATP-binding cassette domain-containing protein [Prevotella sp.]|nr:ATP-binding cassette domain-containing protein [Prevotella sp.]